MFLAIIRGKRSTLDSFISLEWCHIAIITVSFKVALNWLVSRRSCRISETVRNLYLVVFGHKTNVSASYCRM